MEAIVKFVDGLKFVAEGSSGHSLVMDGDAKFGGDDSAPRPTELVLMGLGGCSGMDVVSILKKKRQAFTGFEIVIRGERADSHPRKFTDISMEFIVRGDVAEDAVKRAVQLSMDRYCSVKANLEGISRITYSYRIERDTE